MIESCFFDNHSTTPLDPAVFEAMRVDLEGPAANPSSIHRYGQRARALLGEAREKAARFFGGAREEVFFTSGGTEGVVSLLRSLPPKGRLITTRIEHSCLYNTALSLEKLGMQVSYVPVTRWGAPLPEDVEAALENGANALFLSAANTETGVRLDLEALGAIAQRKSVPFFLDAVAFAGKEPFSLPPGVTGCVISGHKFHAPKGVGAVFLRKKTPFSPLFLGGGQEGGRRAGTENLSGILGLAKALQLLEGAQEKITSHILSLKTRFEQELRRSFPDLIVHGEGPRISSVSNVAIPGVDGEALLFELDAAGIAASHGSACSSGGLEPSRVLLEMGIPKAQVRSAIRFSFSRKNTLEEIDWALEKIVPLIRKCAQKTS